MNVDNLLTPYKYNKPILQATGVKGDFDSVAVDCPMPFRHNGKFYMMYVGFDGVGYQTGLACSSDLINWEKLGVILKRSSNMDWDKVGQAGAWIIQDTDLYGNHTLKKIDGKYWLIYHSYPSEGYESGPASMGLAYTEDENLIDWKFIGNPIFTYDNSITWEGGGLYKCCITEKDDTYYMFYNAKNRDEFPWTEQTGLATSTDLIHWKRYENNPVLKVTEKAWDSQFASDPCVMYDSINKRWVMFYFGFDGKNAMEGVAISDDLINFEKIPYPIIKSGGEIDRFHAHKPGIIYNNGVLYHYYCASREHREGDLSKNGDEFRCITLACSQPFMN